MSDLPILFSGPMVRALLAGTKTQTRRVHKVASGLEHLAGSVLPRIHVGDRLYVREHWRTIPQCNDIAPRDLLPKSLVEYVADEPDGGPTGSMTGARFRQGMHMPKWASRITLHVTEVRVQRLQEISDEDALAEGIEHWPDGSPVSGLPYGVRLTSNTTCAGETPQSAYQALWQQINGLDSWTPNPWVSVTTFKVERCNIAQART